MLKTILTLMLCLSVGFGYSQTQQKTVYEKKKQALTMQFMRNLGVSKTLIEHGEKVGDLEAIFLLGNVMKSINTENGILLMLKYDRELKELEKFKTAIDYKRDKQKQAEIDKKEKADELVRQESQRREKLETEEREKREELAKKEEEKRQQLEADEQEKIEKFNNSDFVILKKSIQEDFKYWLEKGEFEKTEDFQNRIKNQSQDKFEKMNITAIEYSLRKFENNLNEFSYDLLKYNADLECFPIQLKFENLQWIDTLKIPLNDAEKFRTKFSDYKPKVNKEDWCLIDNYWHPKKIKLINTENQQEIEFNVPTKNEYYINYKSGDLGFNQLELKDIYFNLSEYLDKAKNNKKERLIKGDFDKSDLIGVWKDANSKIYFNNDSTYIIKWDSGSKKEGNWWINEQKEIVLEGFVRFKVINISETEFKYEEYSSIGYKNTYTAKKID